MERTKRGQTVKITQILNSPGNLQILTHFRQKFKKTKQKKKQKKKPKIVTKYCQERLWKIIEKWLWIQKGVIGWKQNKTRRFSNHVSCLLSRSHTFAIIVHHSMWIHWPFFPKTWTKGHWPLDDLWPHVCWGHMYDSTQGSLCPSPMTIHRCMWIQW